MTCEGRISAEGEGGTCRRRKGFLGLRRKTCQRMSIGSDHRLKLTDHGLVATSVDVLLPPLQTVLNGTPWQGLVSRIQYAVITLRPGGVSPRIQNHTPIVNTLYHQDFAFG